MRESCCKDVLEYVAKNIKENDALTFLKLISSSSYEDSESEGSQTSEDKVINYFKSKAYQVQWKKLKKCLLALERNEMVDRIESTSLITKGTVTFLFLRSSIEQRLSKYKVCISISRKDNVNA